MYIQYQKYKNILKAKNLTKLLDSKDSFIEWLNDKANIFLHMLIQYAIKLLCMNRGFIIYWLFIQYI